MPDRLPVGGPGNSADLVKLIKERSDDIEKVVIPQHPSIHVVDKDPAARQANPGVLVEAGLVIQFMDGSQKIIHPVDAELLLNDGIFNRMKIPIELFR